MLILPVSTHFHPFIHLTDLFALALSLFLSLEKLANVGRSTQGAVVEESQSVRQHSEMHSNLHL